MRMHSGQASSIAAVSRERYTRVDLTMGAGDAFKRKWRARRPIAGWETDGRDNRRIIDHGTLQKKKVKVCKVTCVNVLLYTGVAALYTVEREEFSPIDFSNVVDDCAFDLKPNIVCSLPTFPRSTAFR